MIAGLVTLDALNGMIEEYGAAPNQPDCSLELKWPNDVFCHGLKLGRAALGTGDSAVVRYRY